MVDIQKHFCKNRRQNEKYDYIKFFKKFTWNYICEEIHNFSNNILS